MDHVLTIISDIDSVVLICADAPQVESLSHLFLCRLPSGFTTDHLNRHDTVVWWNTEQQTGSTSFHLCITYVTYDVRCKEPQGRRQSQFFCICLQDEDSSASIRGSLLFPISNGVVIDLKYVHAFETLFNGQLWVKNFLGCFRLNVPQVQTTVIPTCCSQIFCTRYLHEGG